MNGVAGGFFESEEFGGQIVSSFETKLLPNTDYMVKNDSTKD